MNGCEIHIMPVQPNVRYCTNIYHQ